MRRKYLKNAEQGFTLYELLIAMILVGILSVAVSNFIADWLQASSRTEIRSSLLLNAETAMDEITSDIRLSGSVDTNNRWPDPNGPEGQYGWQTGSQVLILAKIATDSSNNVVFTDPPSDYISQKDDEIYYLSGTTLYRRTLDSDSANDAAVTTCPPADATPTCPTDLAVVTGVSSLSFVYYDANNNVLTPSNAENARSVQISITISQMLDSQTFSESYTTRMVFRNE